MTNRSLSHSAGALGLALCASLALSQGPAPKEPSVTLHVGDPAPAISVVKWAKGSPVDLKDGKIHVVEFWATWCGPCKVGMPHLSGLAEKYKDQVVFSGISVWESIHSKDKTADLTPKVQAFVDHAHDMMDYNVAVDGAPAKMATTWMAAAGQHGIPCAFVVDKAGKVAWIGHPLLGLEDVLSAEVAGTFNQTTAEKIKADWASRMSAGDTDMKSLEAAQKANDYAKQITLCDKLVEEMPFMVTMCAATKYAALTNTDRAAALQYGESLVTQYHNAPLVLSAVASSIVEDKTPIAGSRDYALALKLMQQAATCMGPDYSLSSTYAAVLAKTGDNDGAVRYQSDALKVAQDNGYPAQMITMAEKRLSDYKAVATASKRPH